MAQFGRGWLFATLQKCISCSYNLSFGGSWLFQSLSYAQPHRLPSYFPFPTLVGALGSEMVTKATWPWPWQRRCMADTSVYFMRLFGMISNDFSTVSLETTIRVSLICYLHMPCLFVHVFVLFSVRTHEKSMSVVWWVRGGDCCHDPLSQRFPHQTVQVHGLKISHQMITARSGGNKSTGRVARVATEVY